MESLMQVYEVRLPIAKYSDPLEYASLIRCLGCPEEYNDRLIFERYQTPARCLFRCPPKLMMDTYGMDDAAEDVFELSTHEMRIIIGSDALHLRRVLNPYLDVPQQSDEPMPCLSYSPRLDKRKVKVTVGIGPYWPIGINSMGMASIITRFGTEYIKDIEWIDLSIKPFWTDSHVHEVLNATGPIKTSIEIIDIESLSTLSLRHVTALDAPNIGPTMIVSEGAMRMHVAYPLMRELLLQGDWGTNAKRLQDFLDGIRGII